MKFQKHFNMKAPEIAVLLEETERFREHLAMQDCPSCTEKKLMLVSYVQGPKSWGAKFFCGSCQTKGELNNEGFHIELARKPEEKQEEPEDRKRKTR